VRPTEDQFKDIGMAAYKAQVNADKGNTFLPMGRAAFEAACKIIGPVLTELLTDKQRIWAVRHDMAQRFVDDLLRSLEPEKDEAVERLMNSYWTGTTGDGCVRNVGLTRTAAEAIVVAVRNADSKKVTA